jgi:hypothetical protein
LLSLLPLVLVLILDLTLESSAVSFSMEA